MSHKAYSLRTLKGQWTAFMSVLVLLVVLPPIISADHLTAGNYYYVQEHYQKAIAEYRQYLAGKPERDLDLARYLIAESYRRMGDWDEALRFYSSLVDEYQKSPWADDALLRMANYYLDHGTEKSLSRAIEIFTEIRKNYASGSCHLKAVFGLANVRQKRGEWKAAEHLYQQLLTMNPPDSLAVETLFALGDMYRSQNASIFNPRQSILMYQKILESFPKDAHFPSVYLALGNTYRLMGDCGKALNYYHRILAEYPDSSQSPLAQSLIGLCYEQKRELKRSIAAYEKIKKYRAPDMLKEIVAGRVRRINRLNRKSIQIEAAVIDYRAKEGRAFYEGEVKIFWNDCTIQCPRALAYLSKTLIKASGGVTLRSRRDLKITGQIMHLLPRKQEVTFYGKVRISLINPKNGEEEQITSGTKIRYDFTNDSYVVDE